MNKTHTLKELADIGAKAANAKLPTAKYSMTVGLISTYPDHSEAREAFTKAVLDAVGYKFPVDPEREAFDAWCAANHKLGTTDQFEAWKAGREELRKEVCSDKCEDTKTKPAWIEWKGGPCPIPDTVKRWEYRDQDGFECDDPSYRPSVYSKKWEHAGSSCNHIVAYRIIY